MLTALGGLFISPWVFRSRKRHNATVHAQVVRGGVVVGRTDVIVHSASAQYATAPLLAVPARIPLPVVTAGGGASAGYPDASNTPSVSGTTLTYYPDMINASTTTLTNHVGDLTTTSANQIIDSLNITGTVIVHHPGVIIRKCRIQQFTFFGVDCEDGAFTVSSDADKCVIEDCLIDNPTSGAGATAIIDSNFFARRCRIRDTENGFDLYHHWSVKDCFIYPLYNGGADPHSDCLQTSSGSTSHDGIAQHNTMFSRGPNDSAVEVDGTSCVINAVGTTSFTNLTYDNNVFVGGAFSVYGPQSMTGTNVQITNNKFWTLYHATCGTFGPWTDATDETISGNQLGAFAGGFPGNVITGAWSGSALP